MTIHRAGVTIIQMRIAILFSLSLSSLLFAQEIPKEPLANITQLTSGFSRAGEGYFSPDMKWIIFQAVPQGEEHYQMYVARLHLAENQPAHIDPPIRISPENSRNTCGYFSPAGNSLIFASTTGKEKKDDPSGGYQRQGRNYLWSFPTGMEIFRFDNFQEALSQAKPNSIVDLAKHPLTNNDVYDAEGSFSPDGKYICFTRGGGKDADIYISIAPTANPTTSCKFLPPIWPSMHPGKSPARQRSTSLPTMPTSTGALTGIQPGNTSFMPPAPTAMRTMSCI